MTAPDDAEMLHGALRRLWERPQDTLAPQVVEILCRAALLGERAPGLFAEFGRDELISLAAVALVELLRRDKLDALHPFFWQTGRGGGDAV